ncbi:uncharacterized, partial [Tachysurus ichikawai]
MHAILNSLSQTLVAHEHGLQDLAVVNQKHVRHLNQPSTFTTLAALGLSLLISNIVSAMPPISGSPGRSKSNSLPENCREDASTHLATQSTTHNSLLSIVTIRSGLDAPSSAQPYTERPPTLLVFVNGLSPSAGYTTN